MARNRIIYQTEALYAGPSPATGIDNSAKDLTRQLHRIQSCNYGYNLTRRDVNQFGELAAIDRILLESPVVNLDFSYLNANFFNEKQLGFYVNTGQGDSSAITYLLNKTQDDRNYYVKMVPEGVDAAGYAVWPPGHDVSGTFFSSIGNGFISNFSTEGSVGDFPRSTLSVEGLNILFGSHNISRTAHNSFSGYVNGSEGKYLLVRNPAVNPSNGTAINTGGFASLQDLNYYVPIPTADSNPTYDTLTGYNATGYEYPYRISALRPGDVTLQFLSAGTSTDLNEAGSLISDLKIQSYNLGFSLTRDPLQKLGSKYAFAREIRFPIQVNLSVEANVGDIKTGNLVDVISSDSAYDISVNIASPTNSTLKIMKYTMKNAKLDSQSYTSSIGPNKTVSFNFSSQIGGPLQLNKGLFFSGHLPNISLY